MVFEAPGCYVLCAVVKLQVMKGTSMMILTNILASCEVTKWILAKFFFFYYSAISYFENKPV